LQCFVHTSCNFVFEPNLIRYSNHGKDLFVLSYLYTGILVKAWYDSLSTFHRILILIFGNSSQLTFISMLSLDRHRKLLFKVFIKRIHIGYRYYSGFSTLVGVGCKKFLRCLIPSLTIICKEVVLLRGTHRHMTLYLSTN